MTSGKAGNTTRRSAPTRPFWIWRGACWRAGIVVSLLLLSGGEASLRWARAGQLLDGIAAVVNNEVITISEVRDAMALDAEQLRQHYRGEVLQQRMRALYARALQGMVDLRLQLARARKLHLRVSDEEVTYHINTLKQQNQLSDQQLLQLLKSRGLTLEAYRQQIREGLLVGKVVNAEVRSRLVVLDTELKEAYRRQRNRYRVPGELTVSHILFLVPPEAPRRAVERARKRAELVLQKLHHGGDFAVLARQFSEGPSAERGGLLGTFHTGELLPEFEAAAARLNPGEISGLVRTRAGFHIIRLEARKAGGYRPFEEVKEDLKAQIVQAKTKRKYQAWLEMLRQRAYVKILYRG